MMKTIHAVLDPQKFDYTRLFNMGVLPGYNRSISSSMEARRITRFGNRYQLKTPFSGAIDWSLIKQYQFAMIKQINSYRLIDFYFFQNQTRKSRRGTLTELNAV